MIYIYIYTYTIYHIDNVMTYIVIYTFHIYIYICVSHHHMFPFPDPSFPISPGIGSRNLGCCGTSGNSLRAGHLMTCRPGPGCLLNGMDDGNKNG